MLKSKFSFFSFFVTAFICLVIAHCAIGYYFAAKIAIGINNGDITVEKAGEQVGKFLKGVEQGRTK